LTSDGKSLKLTRDGPKGQRNTSGAERLCDGRKSRVMINDRNGRTAMPNKNADDPREFPTPNNDDDAAARADHEPSADDDGLDLLSLRLPQDFAAAVGIQRVQTTIPVTRPLQQVFVRVHTTWRFPTMILRFEEDSQTFLVDRFLWPEVQSELRPVILYLAITPQSSLLLWPVKLPGTDGRLDSWNTSAHEAAKLLMRSWGRVVTNQDTHSYEVRQAISYMQDPEWPDLDVQRILELGFKDRIIRDFDHPVLRRLRGQT
jgi:hypothetical protein